MGLRSRLIDRLKRTLGPGEAREENPAPPPAPRPPPPAPPPHRALQPELPPAPPPPPAAPTAIPPRVHAAEVAEKLVSDVKNTDAPVRKAHYRPLFDATAAAVTVRVINEEEGVDLTFPCEPGEYVLDAADRAGLELPSSCRSGGCLTCSGLLLSGEADMAEQYVLDADHTAAGFLLLCCSSPRTDLLVRSHQEGAIP